MGTCSANASGVRSALRTRFIGFWRRERTLTTANSTSAAKTKTEQMDIHTSIPFTYETLGREALAPVDCVVMVRTVRRPRGTRAGVASMFSQKLTHDKMTMRILGIYTWMIKNPMSRRNTKRISRHGKDPKDNTNTQSVSICPSQHKIDFTNTTRQ
jgi:hypothetical protein